MCKCTPNIKTPFCGRPGCEVPRQSPEERRQDAFKALITKARDAELTSSEIVDCLRGIAEMNQAGGRARVEITTGADATIYLALYDRNPAYFGKCIEDALIAAHDDITRIIAEDAA